MSRSLRIAGYIGIGIAFGLIAAGVATFVITRTDWGMERARRFAVAWLADRIHGTLQVGSIGGRGLLSGVIIRDFGIVGENGRPFVHADSVELSYNWRTLVSGQIILTRVVLHGPQLQLEQLPGDTIWNYEHIFADTTPGLAEPGRSLIRFMDAHIRNGTAVIRLPFEPSAAIAVEDTARVILEAVPGGMARVFRFEDVDARLDEVVWESPVEPGRLFKVASASARGFVQRDPFVISNAHGTVTTRDTIVALDFQDVTMQGSQADILGTIVQREGENILDIRVDGRRFRFRDLQWLYPRLPDEGGGSVVLRIQTQPRGILFYAEDARIQASGTQLAGTVGVVAGDTLYFTRVNLRASPLDVKLLEQLLPGGLPVEGLLIGTVEVRGPISALETSGDLRLAGGVGAGSEVSWSGVLDLRDGDVAARSLRADVKNLELALLASLNPKVQLDGRVSGRLTGSGRIDDLAFHAALIRDGRTRLPATFEGGGTVRREGDVHAIEINADAASASLDEIAAYVPALAGMSGELRGPLRITGTSQNLQFAGRLATDGGPLTVDGRITSQNGDATRIIAGARAESFRLHALRPGIAEVFVTGEVHIDVTGSGLAHTSGDVRIALDSARVRNLPIGRVDVAGTLGDGVLAIDSASVDTHAGVARAQGTIGLIAERTGRLDLQFASESLEPLERYLIEERATGPDAEPRLAGKVNVGGSLTGWIGSLDLSATARSDGFVYTDLRTTRLDAALGMRGLRSGTASLQFELTGDSLDAWAHPLQSTTVEASGALDSVHVTLNAQANGADVVNVRADVLRPSASATAIRVASMRVGGRSPWLLAAPGTIVLDDGVINVDAFEVSRATGGHARVDGRLAWAADATARAAPLDFAVQLDAVPFADVLAAMRSTAEGAGTIDGTVRFTGTPLDPVVEGEVNGRDLRYGDVRIDHAFAELNYTALGLDAHAEAQYDGRSILTGGGRIPIDLRFTPVAERRLDEPVRFTISADRLPPALPLSAIDGFTNATGAINGTIAVNGTTLEPTLSGGFTIVNGGFDWNVTGIRYRDVSGTFALERDRLLRVDVTARATDPRQRNQAADRAGNGAGTITGTLDFGELTDPGFDLHFGANRVFAARRRDVEATVTGELRLDGRYSRPEISGNVRVDEGALYLDEIYRQYLIVSLDDLTAVDTTLVTTTPVLGQMIANARNPFLKNLRVSNLDLRVGSDTWLRSQDMDVAVSGNLNVALDRSTQDLRLTGSLGVERGTYTLYYPPLQSRRFNVRQGTIEFPGIPGIDPNLSITAAYKARDTQGEPLDILAVVSGSLQNPRIHLTSEGQPGIGESDLASYLFFGVPTSGVTTNTSELRGVAGLGFSALKPSVLGYASSGLQTLAQGVGIDYVAFTTAAEASPGTRTSSAVASFLAETQLELGLDLGSNFFLAYSQRLGSYDPAARVEWRFLPEFTFELFAEDRFARTPGFGLRQESEKLKRVYGFSLFREWGF